MSRVKRNVFLITNSPIGPLDGVKMEQLLIIRREGRGIQWEEATFEPEVQEMTLYSFERRSEKIMPPLPSNIYLQRVLNLAIGGTRNQYFEVGLGINPNGRRYMLTGGLLGDVYYDTVIGDTYANVITGLIAALTAVGYLATSSGNTLIVTMTPADSLEPSIKMANGILYQSGLLAALHYDVNGDPRTDEYLIEVDESNTGFPALPTPASSYNLEDLIYAGNYGVNQYLHDPLYQFREYETTEIGPVDVLGMPGEAIVDPNKVAIDETNDRIIFGTPVEDLEERFEVIWKVT